MTKLKFTIIQNKKDYSVDMTVWFTDCLMRLNEVKRPTLLPIYWCCNVLAYYDISCVKNIDFKGDNAITYMKIATVGGIYQ